MATKKSRLELDPGLGDRICQNVADGMPYTHAPVAEGVAYDTMHDWLQKGRRERAKDPYLTFALNYDKAQSAGMKANLRSIRRAADGGDWRAAAHLLAIQFPHLFGKNRVEITGADGGPIESESVTKYDFEGLLSGVSRDGAREILAIIKRERTKDELAGLE